VVIAQRRLIIADPSGDIEVPVRLFQPEEDDRMWICRYEIDWPNRRESYFAAGADSMQALTLAIRTIGVEIYTSEYHESGTLRWCEQGRGYGFPVGDRACDLIIGDAAKPIEP
jgi:hypothetical protein